MHLLVDGNKRIAHLTMEIFLALNGFEIYADDDEQENVFLRLSDHKMTKSELIQWIENHIIERWSVNHPL